MVKFGKWLEARQNKYRKLINRVHKIIAAVTIAEKEERKKVHTIQKAICGFDPLKWTKTDAEVRGEGHLEVDYQEVHLIAPTKGNHWFAHW